MDNNEPKRTVCGTSRIRVNQISEGVDRDVLNHDVSQIGHVAGMDKGKNDF